MGQQCRDVPSNLLFGLRWVGELGGILPLSEFAHAPENVSNDVYNRLTHGNNQHSSGAHLRSFVSTPASFNRNLFIAQRSSHDSAFTFVSADLPIAFKKASGVEMGPNNVPSVSNAAR